MNVFGCIEGVKTVNFLLLIPVHRNSSLLFFKHS